MQVSLRSRLSAGTAVVIAAGTVSVVPAIHSSAFSLPAGVALAGFNNPIEAVIATAQMAQNDIFAGYYNGGDVPTPGAGEANWPYAGFDQTGGDVLNYLLYQDKSLGRYRSVGLLPQAITDAQPIISQLALNWYEYLNVTLTGVTSAATAVAAGLWNLPGAVVEAAQLLFDGQLEDAITTLVDAVVAPITTAVGELWGAAVQVADTVAARVAAVAAVIPTNLGLLADWALGTTTAVVQEAIAVGTAWVDKVVDRDIEGAWNTAVDGLLAPSGLPGLALNLSVGAGVQTGPILDPANDIRPNFVPSLRTVTQASIWNTQNALATTAQPSATPAAAVDPTVESDSDPGAGPAPASRRPQNPPTGATARADDGRVTTHRAPRARAAGD